MNKIIPILALLILPLTTQALTVSGNGSAAVSTGKTETEIRSDITLEAKDSDNKKEDSSVNSELDAIESLTDDLEIELEASTTKIANALRVTNDTDLDTFKETIRATNKNVESVDTESETGIAVAYSHSAKLFWFIPIHIRSTTVVRANTDGAPVVETTFPWWKLFVNGVSDTSDAVDSSLSASESAKIYAKATTSARAKAVLTETIIATLNADEGVSLLGQ